MERGGIRISGPRPKNLTIDKIVAPGSPPGMAPDPMNDHAPAPPLQTVVRAGAGLRSRFGTPAAWTAAAPGRVNLIGEHVDYSGGLVLPIAIDRWALAVAAPARGPATRVFSIDLDRMESTDDPPAGSSALAAVIRRFPADVPPLDIALTSDVPRGAGLSSSAAVEVALATVLEAATDERLHPRDKARLCQLAEHDVGVPCGIMDMYAATSAEPMCALSIDCETLVTRAVPLPPPEDFAVVVINTKVNRTLAVTAYAERREACAQVAAQLDIANLRAADRTMIDRASLSLVHRRRAEHVVAENDRTRRAVEMLERGDLAAFGDLLFASHDSLRVLYEVSCPELDTIVDAARRLRDDGVGVIGARMTGAGFGGCAIVVCRGGAVAETARQIRAAFVSAYGREVAPFVVRAVGGSAVL